jgi:hypothetical protein
MAIKPNEAIDLIVNGRTPEEVYRIMTEDGGMSNGSAPGSTKSPSPGASSASPSPNVHGTPSSSPSPSPSSSPSA